MNLSPKDIGEHRFKTAISGYNKGEVRNFLGELERAMRSLEEHLAIETARAEHSENELTELQSRTDDLVAEATEARHKMIEQAKREATEIVVRAGAGAGAATIADAAECAAGIITRAEADAKRQLDEAAELCEAARVEVDRTLNASQNDAAATKAEASRVLEDARREARIIRGQAEAERAVVVEEVSRLERIAESERNGNLESLEVANVILRSGTEITIDLRDEALTPGPTAPG